jgi:hypothetical protein
MASWVRGCSATTPASRSVYPDLVATPESASPPPDLHAQTVTIPSKSGATLRGWFIVGRPGGGAVVLMHGIHSNRLSMEVFSTCRMTPDFVTTAQLCSFSRPSMPRPRLTSSCCGPQQRDLNREPAPNDSSAYCIPSLVRPEEVLPSMFPNGTKWAGIRRL